MQFNECPKCGMEFEIPEWDTIEPFYKYTPKLRRAILKHGWEHHREDFPPQFTSFTKFMRWITTPEGQEWDSKQHPLIEAEKILQNYSGNPKKDSQIPKCPHCKHQLNRISEIRTTTDILYYRKENDCYFWANDEDEVQPKGISFRDDYGEMALRAGYEPEYSSSMYLCPICFYTLPKDWVESSICKNE